MVAVLLAEECDSTELLCLLNRNVAVVGKLDVLADACVHDALYLLDLLVCHLLEVREVETDSLWCNE